MGDAHRRADRGTSAGHAGVTRPGGRGPRRPPSCHDRSAAAARAKASNAPHGVEQVVDVVRRAAEVLAGERQPEIPGEAPRPVAEPTWVDRRALVEGVVEHGEVSSESCVHDRRLKLSEPTVAHMSSTMQTLACT